MTTGEAMYFGSRGRIGDADSSFGRRSEADSLKAGHQRFAIFDLQFAIVSSKVGLPRFLKPTHVQATPYRDLSRQL